MRTREITEILVYKLVLNPLKGHEKSLVCLAVSYDLELLKEWYISQLTDQYFDSDKEKQYTLFFKEDSPLKWFRPISFQGENAFKPNALGQGIHEMWMTFDKFKNDIETAKASFGFIRVPELVGMDKTTLYETTGKER